LTAGGSAVLNVSAGTAAPGTYTLTVTGTEGAATHAATVLLTVTAPGAPDFSISASPSSLSLAPGTSGSSSISTAVVSGSAGTVILAVSGVPSGATASLSPASLTAGSSAVLNVSAGTAAAGSYTLTVTGTEGAATHAATVTLTVAVGSLVNGGFESGSTTGWTTAGTTSIVTSGCHGGAYCALAGSTSPTNGDSSFTQTFTVPVGFSQLSVWYSTFCPDSLTYDWVTITLKNVSNGSQLTLLPQTCPATASWTNVTASVVGGQTYTLTLTNHDDNYPGDATYTLFDDVTLN
jgi:hypothetical protein